VWIGVVLMACGVLVMLTQRGERSAIEGERA
jgi:cytochrome c biogenesis factor